MFSKNKVQESLPKNQRDAYEEELRVLENIEKDKAVYNNEQPKGIEKLLDSADKDITSIMPIKDVYTVEEFGRKEVMFTTQSGTMFNILKIVPKDLVNISDSERTSDYASFNTLFSSYDKDLTIISASEPSDTKQQQINWLKILARTNDTAKAEFIKLELDIEKWLEKNRIQRVYYLLEYGKNEDECFNNEKKIISTLGDRELVRELSTDKKFKALFKFYNPLSSVFDKSETKLKKRKKDFFATADVVNQQTLKNGYNTALVNAIQPRGGISFKDERYIKTGDGYQAILDVYEFPYEVEENWLDKIVNISGVTAFVDIASADVNEVIREANKSTMEQKARAMESKDASQRMEAINKYQQSEIVLKKLVDGSDVMKLLRIRLFVSDYSVQALDEKVGKIITSLENQKFRCQIMLNENKEQWLSMFRPYNEQLGSIYSREGQPAPASAVAGGNPFHFTELNDPMGCYYGTTDASGNVHLDLFAHTNRRMSYNGIVIGTMGAGKSTTLKKIILDRGLRGDYIRCFDVTGEYTTLINTLGGKIISLDGSNGVLNALEILKTDEDEETCWATHVSKLSIMYQLLSGKKANSDEVKVFENVTTEFYEDIGLRGENVQMTGLPSSAYPTFSELLEYIEKKINQAKEKADKVQTDLLTKRIKELDSVRLTISSMVKNYGNLFDGHTSIDNILNTEIVCFNVANLKNLKSEVFEAQIFLAQSLWWDNCVRIGSKEKELVESGQKSADDAIHFLGVIDEAHTMINANKTVTLEQLERFCKEARKYFGGLIFATQSIRDFVPETASSEGVEKIKKIFELATYKFIMKQDDNCINLLSNVFTQLTPAELNKIPKLEKGHCTLVIQGDENITFKFDVMQRELDIFKGGV